MKRSEYRIPAICINDHDFPFTDWILTRQKDIETRSARTLDPFIGKRVVLIRTGCGQAEAVGEVDITRVFQYWDYSDFRADEFRHMVEQGSKYDCKPDGIKYGYVIANPSVYTMPIPLPKWTYTGDRVARDLGQWFDQINDLVEIIADGEVTA